MQIQQPKFELVSAGTPSRFRLTDDYCVTLDSGLRLVAPTNFITDLASVPSLFWSIPGFSPDGPLIYGAILHDFGYQYGYLLAKKKAGRIFSNDSKKLYGAYPYLFGEFMPVFVGRPQEFFDFLLKVVTIEATGKKFIARTAKFVLSHFGGSTWDLYRTTGPTAHNTNSLGLPGLTTGGVVF